MLQRIQSRPMVKRLLWTLFAVLFYQSGLTVTVWLFEPASFAGGLQWIWVMMFPVMLPAFFVVNRYLGCASGACHRGQCEGDEDSKSLTDFQRPPGF